jgi:hypothetical protein
MSMGRQCVPPRLPLSTRGVRVTGTEHRTGADGRMEAANAPGFLLI